MHACVQQQASMHPPYNSLLHKPHTVHVLLGLSGVLETTMMQMSSIVMQPAMVCPP